MKDLGAFPEVAEMYGDKSEELEISPDLSDCYRDWGRLLPDVRSNEYHHIPPIQNSRKTQVSHYFMGFFYGFYFILFYFMILTQWLLLYPSRTDFPALCLKAGRQNLTFCRTANSACWFNITTTHSHPYIQKRKECCCL